MMLIVELVTVWFAVSVAVGLPLARRIRLADAAEFPWRREDPWWVTETPAHTEASAGARPDAPAHASVPALV